MGEGYGPMIVAKQGLSLEEAQFVPLRSRPQNFCISWVKVSGGDVNVEVVPFEEIILRILDDTYACGLIIHEGQLTYVEHDLNVLIDLECGGTNVLTVGRCLLVETLSGRPWTEGHGRHHNVQNEH